MSPPLDSATKERVIEKHLEGLGRNEIARELGISTGSVSNILKTYGKRGIANTPVKEVLESQVPETQAQAHVNDSIDIIQSSDLPLQEQKRPTANVGSVASNTSVVQGDFTVKIPHPTDPTDIASNNNMIGPPIDNDKRDKDQTQTQEIDWDLDLGRRLWARISEEKKLRHDELLQIQQKKTRLLELQKAQEEFESRYHYLMPLIPMAKQLHDQGITMDLLIPWQECVYECAEAEKIDFGDAAYKVIQDLSDIRQYRQLGSLEKSIQQAQQQLTMLNIVILQKQQAISTLMTLQNRGVSLEEIYGLTNPGFG